MPTANARASCARPCGPFPPPSRRTATGTRERSALLRAEAQCDSNGGFSLLSAIVGSSQRLASTAFSMKRAFRFVSIACAQERAASDGSPSAAVNAGRKSPRGRAHDARAFAVSAGMCCRRTSAGVHSPARQDAWRALPLGCPFLGLPFFGQAKKGNRPAGMRDEHARMRVGYRE